MESSVLTPATEALRTILADWRPLVAGAAVLGFVLLVYLVWLLRAVVRELRALPDELERVWQQAAQEPPEVLQTAADRLAEIDRKLAQILPANFRVRSIRAENLVVSPPGNGERPARRTPTQPDIQRW